MADRWLARVLRDDIEGIVPDLVYAEFANAVHGETRAGNVEPRRAEDALALLLETPLSVVSCAALAKDALEDAKRRGISVYDACYSALAGLAGGVLVTADRRLAAAFSPSVLLREPSP